MLLGISRTKTEFLAPSRRLEGHGRPAQFDSHSFRILPRALILSWRDVLMSSNSAESSSRFTVADGVT